MATHAVNEYARGVRTSIRGNSAAYGYSVMITSVLSMLTVVFGRPATWHFFLFGAGAAAAFTVLEAAASGFFRQRVRGEPPEVVMLGSAMSVMSISSGIAAGLALATLAGSWVVWLTAPFAASVVYLLVLGIEMALARRAEGEPEET